MNQLALINNNTTAIIETNVAALKPLAQQLIAIKIENAKFHFDMSDEKQREDAKSHVYKLRKMKAEVERTAKAEREESLRHQKAVIADEKLLVAEIVEMIDLHAQPIKAWEDAEKNRVAVIQERIAGMTVTAENVLGRTSDELKALFDAITAINTETGFDEFSGQAFAARIVALDFLKAQIAVAEKAEADARELAQLQAEKAEREAKALAEAAAKEASEQAAKQEAERAAEAERQRIMQERAADEARAAAEIAAKKREAELLAEQERLKQQAMDAAVKAKHDRIAAAEKAEADKLAAVAAEKARIAKAAADQKAIDDARIADREHRAKINREIVASFAEILHSSIINDDSFLVAETQAKAIITAIALGKIQHITINY